MDRIKVMGQHIHPFNDKDKLLFVLGNTLYLHGKLIYG